MPFDIGLPSKQTAPNGEGAYQTMLNGAEPGKECGRSPPAAGFVRAGLILESAPITLHGLAHVRGLHT
jgi:hypothetical protein